jgi:hypothetical protein
MNTSSGITHSGELQSAVPVKRKGNRAFGRGFCLIYQCTFVVSV